MSKSSTRLDRLESAVRFWSEARGRGASQRGKQGSDQAWRKRAGKMVRVFINALKPLGMRVIGSPMYSKDAVQVIFEPTERVLSAYGGSDHIRPRDLGDAVVDRLKVALGIRFHKRHSFDSINLPNDKSYIWLAKFEGFHVIVGEEYAVDKDTGGWGKDGYLYFVLTSEDSFLWYTMVTDRAFAHSIRR